jgi:hypothetical protein
LCRLHWEGDGFLAELPGLTALLESIVVQLAAHFQRSAQTLSLSAVRVQAIFKRSSDFQHIVL